MEALRVEEEPQMLPVSVLMTMWGSMLALGMVHMAQSQGNQQTTCSCLMTSAYPITLSLNIPIGNDGSKKL